MSTNFLLPSAFPSVSSPGVARPACFPSRGSSLDPWFETRRSSQLLYFARGAAEHQAVGASFENR